MAEKEKEALAKLQAAAGLVVEKPQLERLDWMYEQSVAQSKEDADTLMNTPVQAQKDKDVEDIKRLGDSTAGSLFLRSATKTTEDMLRKLREDPLFQVRRQEQLARESMLANPLVRARLQKKADKLAKKQRKKEKKAAKKQKKVAKKAKKAAKKAAKGSSSSSSSDTGSDQSPCSAGPEPASRQPSSARNACPSEASPSRQPGHTKRELGPGMDMVSKREEYSAMLAARKEAALASRGAPRRMDEDEKRRRLERMHRDAATHEAFKDRRIASAEQREREQEEQEARLRMSSDQKFFRDMRQDTYMDGASSVADRLKSQRHRRQKNINDPLERDE